ncbi:MAG TPA: serine/threonine-protein kinase [Kofleriaceae bacterium]
MPCPEPEVLGSFVEDGVEADVRVSVEAHLDECDECRRTVALLARARAAEQAPTRPSDDTLASADTELDRGASRRELAPGTHVGRYVIREIIGKGGMGVVYGAEDPDLHREVAIKLLRHDFARTQPDATRRIVREAQAMAKISHPNVVAVFDVGTFGDQVFIAMERVHGGSLRDWIGRQVSIAAIVDAFVAAGRGLIAAHDAGVVHRDFKPDNVLVGDDDRVRVTDFGLALDESSDRLSSPELASGTLPIAGTPAYMAPEQHAGANLDPRTDQFSFCVALYEALYGRRPFAGSTRTELVATVSSGTVTAAPVGSRVPRSLRAILVRGLSPTPGDRFPTMTELLRALGRDRGRRPRQLARGAAVLLLAVLVGLAADWVARGRANAITKTSFGAARAQLGRLFELRTRTFRAQSDLVINLHVIQQVIDNRDEAEFGLGTPERDRSHRRGWARRCIVARPALSARSSDGRDRGHRRRATDQHGTRHAVSARARGAARRGDRSPGADADRLDHRAASRSHAQAAHALSRPAAVEAARRECRTAICSTR